MKTFFICALFTLHQFLVAGIIPADEWSLETQPLKHEWGLKEQTPNFEWGLEEQTVKHEKSDSIILHYDGKAWGCIYNGHGIWLDSIYGFDWNDIFVAGDNGVILHYDGNSWAKQESNVTCSLNRIWGNRKDNIYVVGINSSSHYNHISDVSYGTKRNK